VIPGSPLGCSSIRVKYIRKVLDLIPDPTTIADALLDRVIHRSHKIDIKGPSMRKEKSRLTLEGKSPKSTWLALCSD
jgi:hypothetical protein